MRVHVKDKNKNKNKNKYKNKYFNYERFNYCGFIANIFHMSISVHMPPLSNFC